MQAAASLPQQSLVYRITNRQPGSGVAPWHLSRRSTRASLAAGLESRVHTCEAGSCDLAFPAGQVEQAARRILASAVRG